MKEYKLDVNAGKRELSGEEQLSYLAREATHYRDLIQALQSEAVKYGFTFTPDAPNGMWWFKETRPEYQRIGKNHTLTEAVALIFELAAKNGKRPE